jgi:hypothetical protein
MNTIKKYILPELELVVEEIASNENDVDYGHAPPLTLIALIILQIVKSHGDHEEILNFVSAKTDFTPDDIQFLLDQYEGKKRRFHLWQKKPNGDYALLI